MSKKKNTLNDLEEFLKLQASSLVTPSSLTEKVKDASVAPEPKKIEPVVAVVEEEDLVKKVQRLAADKKEFYNFIIQVTEGLSNKSKEDTLLINTALYLKGGSDWKAEVANYWKTK
jgi:hypothetical protein